MVVASGFIQRAEAAQSRAGPERPATFEAALLLPTGRFDGARANGPPLAGDLLVVHARGVPGKIILFARDGFPSLTRAFLESSHLPKHARLATVPQVVPLGFNPRRKGR